MLDRGSPGRTDAPAGVLGPSRARIPFLAAGWCGAYAVVHLWWAVAGAPTFLGRGESFFPGGWVPVVPASVAASASLLDGIAVVRRRGRSPSARWLLGSLAALGGGAMIAYCMLAWTRLAMLLMVPFGSPMTSPDVGLLVLRTSGVVGGGLALWTARAAFQQDGPGCDGCGRDHATASAGRTAPSQWWGCAGAYLAIAGLLARLVPDAPRMIVQGVTGPGGVGFDLFVALMIIAGTVLPLALAQRWGRIWPGWVRPWAGRRVPRWLVLGPGVFMGTGLVAYFGAGGISAMISGQAPSDPGAVLMIGGYTAWGIGLLIASTSYHRLTRPPCPLPAQALTRT
jgi:hypothetical protein